MIANFHKLLSAEYLINIDPVMLHRTDKALLVLGVVLVIVGIVCRLTGTFAPHPFARRLWLRLATWALTIGLLEVLWFGLRYEHTLYLGSHLVAFIILLIGLAWLAPILKYWLGRYRREVEQWHKDEIKQKYLQAHK